MTINNSPTPKNDITPKKTTPIKTDPHTNPKNSAAFFKKLLKEAVHKPIKTDHIFNKTDNNTYQMSSFIEKKVNKTSETLNTNTTKNTTKSKQTASITKKNNPTEKTSKNNNKEYNFINSIINEFTISIPHLQDIINFIKQRLHISIEKKEFNQITTYIFKTALNSQEQLDIGLERKQGKIYITLFAKGELKELLMNNVEALIEYLKKKDINISEIVIKEPPQNPNQQNKNNNSDNQSKENPDQDPNP